MTHTREEAAISAFVSLIAETSRTLEDRAADLGRRRSDVSQTICQVGFHRTREGDIPDSSRAAEGPSLFIQGSILAKRIDGVLSTWFFALNRYTAGAWEVERGFDFTSPIELQTHHFDTSEELIDGFPPLLRELLEFEPPT